LAKWVAQLPGSIGLCYFKTVTANLDKQGRVALIQSVWHSFKKHYSKCKRAMYRSDRRRYFAFSANQIDWAATRRIWALRQGSPPTVMDLTTPYLAKFIKQLKEEHGHSNIKPSLLAKD
jgi:hypothetical protein